jgi:sigma-B regulation protein RsbU (phosphoserine phosphatase)
VALVRILVVDDDAPSRAVLARQLERLGHSVVTAPDGEAAWATFRESPDLECVITDWTMPGLSGPDLCRRIRGGDARPWTYLLLLTSKEATSDLVEGLLAGADEFMTKPHDVEVLRARLHVAQRILTLEQRLRERVRDLEAALAEVRTLRGLLPICMYCKKIREGADAWQAVEQYVSRHSDAQFSHGVCPTCWTAHVKPQLDEIRAGKRGKATLADDADEPT